MFSVGMMCTAVKSCKKAMDFVNDIKKVPAEAGKLWRLVDSVQVPFEVAMMLMNRAETHTTVAPAVIQTQEVLASCESLLMRDSGDADDRRPNEQSSWDKWWNAIPDGKQSLTRMKMIPVLIADVRHCEVQLAAALQAVQMKFSSSPSGTMNGTQPIVFRRASLSNALLLINLFEMGRLQGCNSQHQLCLCSGVWRSTSASTGMSTKLSDWQMDTRAAGLILRQVENGSYEIVLVDIEDTIFDADADSECSPSRGSGLNSDAPHAGTVMETISVGSDWNVQRAFDSTQGPESPFSEGVNGRTANGAAGGDSALVPSGLRYIIGSSNTPKSKLMVEFAACSDSGQLCPFPKTDERKIPVTVEVFEFVLALLLLQQKKKTPTVSEALTGKELQDEKTILDLMTANFGKFA